MKNLLNAQLFDTKNIAMRLVETHPNINKLHSYGCLVHKNDLSYWDYQMLKKNARVYDDFTIHKETHEAEPSFDTPVIHYEHIEFYDGSFIEIEF